MPRNMSFAMTMPQILDETKVVTRRFGWWFLKPGERVWAVKKAMGLKKGEKIERLRQIEIVSVRKETPEELQAALADELADTFIYLDLVAQSQGIDLEAAVIAKFNKTSEKIGYENTLFNRSV